MTRQQLDEFMEGSDHKDTMVLSIARPERSPLSIPLTFRWDGSSIRFSTKRSRLHTKAFLAAGRATALIHHEQYESGVQLERYVAVEGPVMIPAGAEGDPDVFVEAVLTAESVVGVIYDFSD